MAQVVSQPRPAAVAAVLARSSQWTSARRKSDGRPFYFVPSTTSDAVYMADSTGCTCPSAQNRAGVCKHSAAVAQRQAAPSPAPTKSYADLYPACSVNGCDEDAGRSGRCMDHNRRFLAND